MLNLLVSQSFDKEKDITGFRIPSLEMVTIILLTPSKPFKKLIDGLIMHFLVSVVLD